MSDKKTKKRLKNLSVVEVSLVGRPANGKQFLLTKGEPKMELTEKQKGIMATPFDTEEKFMALLQKEEVNLTDEAQSALMSSMRMLAAYSEEMPEQLLGMMRDALGMEEEKAEDTEEAESTKTTDSHHEDQTEKSEADIIKSLSDLPEAVRDQVENLFKEKQEALAKFDEVQKKLEEEKQEKIRKEFVDKASSEYKHIPSINAEDLGSVVKSLHDLDPAIAEKIESVLKASDTAIEKGGLFDEIGKKSTTTEEGGTAYEKMRRTAAAMVQKGEAGSIEKAIDTVMKNNPELYQDYLAGN